MPIENLPKVWPEWTAEKPIGNGANGVVYQAVRTDYAISAYSAIKVITVPDDNLTDALKAEGLDDNSIYRFSGDLVHDLIGEIKIMESFKGLPNIVSIEDYKVYEDPDRIGWDIFIRMELLTPLNTYTSDKELSEEEVIRMGCDMCSALEVMHARNIIHRDIKPGNVFINKFGNYKLGDFGTARKIENLTTTLTRRTGTDGYMAPEIFFGRHYDVRADVYSVGIMLYRMLNNRRLPFMNPDKQLLSPSERAQALERQMSGEPLPPPKKASAEMTAVILKAAQYDPSERYASAAELKKALESIGKSVTAAPKPDLRKVITAAAAVLVAGAAIFGGVFAASRFAEKDDEPGYTAGIAENAESGTESNADALKLPDETDEAEADTDSEPDQAPEQEQTGNDPLPEESSDNTSGKGEGYDQLLYLLNHSDDFTINETTDVFKASVIKRYSGNMYEEDYGVDERGLCVPWTLMLEAISPASLTITGINCSWTQETEPAGIKPGYNLTSSGNAAYAWDAALNGITTWSDLHYNNDSNRHELFIYLPDDPDISGKQFIDIDYTIGNSKCTERAFVELLYEGAYSGGGGWTLMIEHPSIVNFESSWKIFSVGRQGYNRDLETVEWVIDVQLDGNQYCNNLLDVYSSWCSTPIDISSETHMNGNYSDFGWQSALEGNTLFEVSSDYYGRSLVTLVLPDDESIAGRQSVTIKWECMDFICTQTVEFDLIYNGGYTNGLGWLTDNIVYGKVTLIPIENIPPAEEVPAEIAEPVTGTDNPAEEVSALLYFDVSGVGEITDVTCSWTDSCRYMISEPPSGGAVSDECWNALLAGQTIWGAVDSDGLYNAVIGLPDNDSAEGRHIVIVDGTESTLVFEVELEYEGSYASGKGWKIIGS